MAENKLHIDTWNSLLEGNPSSLEELYNQHYIGLLNYGIKLTHQRELTMDSIFQLFLTLWDSRIKLPPVKNVRSYLITCLHRDLLRHARRDKAVRVDGIVWEELYPDKEFSYEDYLVQSQQNQDRRQKVMQAFGMLSQREKELLQLKFFEDKDYDEIAHCCNITKRTAYNIIYSALKSLKDALVEKNQGWKKPPSVLNTLRSFFF